jgi:hypothetical protein
LAVRTCVRHPSIGKGRKASSPFGSAAPKIFCFVPCEDTEGEPLPEASEVGDVTGDILAGAWDALAAW